MSTNPITPPPTRPALPEGWKRIVQDEGPETGMYLVAYFDIGDNAVRVGEWSCIDGTWRNEVFQHPFAWMPKPKAPTLEDFGLVEWAKELREDWSS